MGDSKPLKNKNLEAPTHPEAASRIKNMLQAIHSFKL
jgi:hypothetical protein